MVKNKPELRVSLGPHLSLSNPVITASGTFGYGEEFRPFVDLDTLGAIVVKGISLKPRPGNPPPRIMETACGMLNAIGLENKGIDHFLQKKIPVLDTYRCPVIVNILGDSVADYATLAAKLDHTAMAAIEINISCPNVKKGGVAFGSDPKMVKEVTEAVRAETTKPIIVKLSPNVTDITVMAKAAEEGGADVISLINTLLGMAIDPQSRRPRLANVMGGLSGPAIKPVALRMVYQAASAVSIPIIGIGGIRTVDDIIEFLLAGATAIQIGTANLVDPAISGKMVSDLSLYLQQHKITSITELIGAVEI